MNLQVEGNVLRKPNWQPCACNAKTTLKCAIYTMPVDHAFCCWGHKGTSTEVFGIGMLGQGHLKKSLIEGCPWLALGCVVFLVVVSLNVGTALPQAEALAPATLDLSGWCGNDFALRVHCTGNMWALRAPRGGRLLAFRRDPPPPSRSGPKAPRGGGGGGGGGGFWGGGASR